MAIVNLTLFNDVYVDSNFSNTIYAWSGDDTVWGQGGNDIIYGGLGNDRLYGGLGIDRLYGEDGSDRLYGGENTDYLYGGGGNDSLLGDAGNDFLYGNAGNDTLNGGANDDVLVGSDSSLLNGFEKDLLIGGTGGDRFYLTNLAGNSVLYANHGFDDYALINDLAIGGADRIYLDGAAAYTFGITGVDGRTGVGIFKDNGILGTDLVGLVNNTNNVAAVAAQVNYI
ncbi:MAG: hypothetical protein MUF72_20810 [Elainella sp. Prado103]|nr:hypothetical protein [Elainella sp. Prado103]